MKLWQISLGAIAVAIVAATADAASDPERGKDLYESRCFACHSLDANRVGPKHRGVYGRKAGSIADFNYSPTVKNSKIVWDEQTLDRWLTSPQDFIPGARMGFRVGTAEDRGDIIAYLKKESGK
jgi:cytochrome c